MKKNFLVLTMLLASGMAFATEKIAVVDLQQLVSNSSQVKQLKQEYPQINYAVVLAYMPGKKTEYDDYSDTMLPEGIESVHPHYAISWRNNWMLKQSDYVVTYITRFFGGAAQYAQKARNTGKRVINIGT